MDLLPGALSRGQGMQAALMKFTASQTAAVNFTGRNLQLIACAGSGKTEVVAQRVLKILRRRRKISESTGAGADRLWVGGDSLFRRRSLSRGHD
jgi:hypothetical protein